ncbi:lachesin-like isoform X2 [Limulus polyphemus]|uniref:Lachesin-like isoform X2 n=1 Tax=Limulus polyphemus TaxID=6850 RepID=A0ABM1BR91_LIMPO|nr:lachesin-like isoform X2 [Limulus polyphemus]
MLDLSNMIFVFAILTYWMSVDAQQNPVISYITKERVVNIGDNVDLQCSVQYASNYPVLWTKIKYENPSSNLFISKDSTLIVPDPRYSIRHDEASKTYTLQISKIQEMDAGIYQCQVLIGSTSKITADVSMLVRIPPVISDNSTRSVITSSGATVSLHCYASGFPIPRVSWRRENNDLLPTGGAVYRGNVLTIHDITKDDRGTYYCVADNGVGRGARRNVGLEVEFAPFVTVDRPRYGQALQYDMDLQCHVEAFPSPSIIWVKDGYQLNDNQHYKISIFATADEFTDSTLRVISIEKKQYGNYTCKAINKLGSHQMNIALIETVNVICPPACGLSLLSAAVSKEPSLFPVVFTMAVASIFTILPSY